MLNLRWFLETRRNELLATLDNIDPRADMVEFGRHNYYLGGLQEVNEILSTIARNECEI